MKLLEKSSVDKSTEAINNLYNRLIKEIKETEEGTREKEVLLDKLKIYTKGKKIVLDNSR